MFKKIYNSPTIMSWASNFVRFGSLIFVLPLILTTYSELEQSLWFLTSTIIGFAMLADSGFGSVLVRAVAYFKAGADSIPKTKEEYEKKEEIKDAQPNIPLLVDLLTTSRRVYLFLSILVIIMLLTVGIAFVWNLMKLSGYRFDFWLAYALLIPYSVISISNVKWNSFVKGLNYVAMQARLFTVTSAIRIMLFIILLLLKLKPAALIAVMLLEALFKFWYLRSFILQWIKDHGGTIRKSYFFNREIFWSIWPATWKLAGIFWGNYLVGSGNSIIMAQVSNPTLMSSFLFTNRIIGLASGISQTPFLANLPVFFKFAAQKKLQDLKIKSSQYIFLGLTLMVTACLFIALFGNWVLQSINTDTRFLAPGLLFILCLSVLLDMHASFHGTIYTTTNHIPFLIPAIVSGALVVGIGFYVLPIYGLIGILLVRFFVELSLNNWYAVYLSLKLLHWPLKKYIFEVPRFGLIYLKNKSKEFNPFKRQ